jgi:hypothetical protein
MGISHLMLKKKKTALFFLEKANLGMGKDELDKQKF